jgi:hypothetical protein
LFAVVVFYVAIGGTYSLVTQPAEYQSVADAYLRRVFHILIVATGIPYIPKEIGRFIQKEISGKDAKCKQEVEAEDLCQLGLEKKYVVYDWDLNKCTEKFSNGCNFKSAPQFDLQECQKLCE